MRTAPETRRTARPGQSENRRAAAGQQPHFIATPHRTDRAQHLPPLAIRARYQELDDARPQVESVQHHVHGDHHRHQHEPGRLDHASSGPCSISWYTSSRNSMAKTAYMPMNPINVNSALPAETCGDTPSGVRIRP